MCVAIRLGRNFAVYNESYSREKLKVLLNLQMNACVDTIALINETTLGTFIYFASADVDFWHFLWSLDKWNGAIRWVSLNIFASQLPYQFEFFVVEYRV